MVQRDHAEGRHFPSGYRDPVRKWKTKVVDALWGHSGLSNDLNSSFVRLDEGSCHDGLLIEYNLGAVD